MQILSDPFVLLGCYVRSGRDSLCWVYQEEDEDLSVTRFSGILQVEWPDLVLMNVRKRDASVRFGDHTADFLHTRIKPDTHVSQFTGLGRRWCLVTYLSIL